MDKITNNLSKYTLHKTIVDCLEKDGVICNSSTKDYNEQETLNGGSGFRLSFTKYNTKISDYHTLLKVLSGEQRANITESIPVIDFLDNSNTSLLYTYDIDNSTGLEKLDVTSIHSADQDGSTPLDLIENEDPFIINRVVSGEEIAEHFYNTNGTPSEPSIQVSPWLGNDFTEFKFRGIYSSPLIINGEFFDSSLIRDSFKSSYISSISDGSSIIQIQLLEAYAKENGVFAEDLKYKEVNAKIVTPDMIKNGECKVENTTFITEDTDSPYGRYNIELAPEDVVILLPQSSYGSTFSQLFIFKYLNDNQAIPEDALTFEPYRYRNIESTSDEDLYITVEDSISTIKSAEVGDTFFLKDYPYGAMYLDSPNLISVPEEFTSNCRIRCIEAFAEGENNKNKWESYGSGYAVYVLPISYYSSNIYLSTISPDDSIPSYLRRTDIYDTIQKIVNIEKIYTSNASGLLDGLYSEPYEISPNNLKASSTVVSKWKFLDESSKAEEKNASISIGSKYFSGHLLNRGFFSSSPLRLTSKDYIDPVTEEFIVPKLTLSTGEEINCKGKLSHTYQVLSTAVSKLFESYQVEDFNNFLLRSLDEVITKADLKEKNYTISEAKDLLGVVDSELGTANKYSYSSKLNYSQKFSNYLENTTEGTCEESFISYFESLVKDIDKGMLTLDLTKGENCVYARNTKQSTLTTVKETQAGGSSGKQEEKQYNTTQTSYYSGDTSSFSKLYSDPNINYAVSYQVTLGDISILNDHGTITLNTNESTYKIKKGTSLQNVSIKLLTPLEALSPKTFNSTEITSFLYNSEDTSSLKRTLQTKKAPKGTILLYPEYNKTLPHTLFIVSNEDLQLDPENRSLVSFLSKPTNDYPDSVISFKVSAKYKYAPSEIKKVKLITSDATQILDYKNGLYSKVIPTATGKVNGFRTIEVKASNYNAYNGNYIVNQDGYRIQVSWRDIIDGKYHRDDTKDIIVSSNTSISSSNSLRSLSKKAARLLSLTSEIENQSLEDSGEEKENLEITQKNSYGLNNLKISKDDDINYLSLDENLLSSKTSEEGVRKSFNSNTEILTNVNLKSLTSKKSKNTTYESKLKEILMGGSSGDTINVSGINWKATERNADYSYDRDDFSDREDYLDWLKRNDQSLYINVPTYELLYSYNEVPDTSFDCYIYVLEDVKISADNIRLYDQADEKINSIYSEGVKLLPVSYPSDFFAVTTSKDKNGADINCLRNKLHVNSLKDRLIIPGLPKFDTQKDFEKSDLGLPNVNLTPLINMIYAKDSTVNKASQNILRTSILDILKNFKLTGLKEEDVSGATSLNPFLLKDLPSLVKGLVEAKPVFQKICNSSFNIEVNGETHTITEDDLYTLIQIIDTDLTIPTFDYEIIQTYDEEDSSQWESTVGSSEYEKAFKKELKRRLDGISIQGKNVIQASRPSLKKISKEIEIALEGKGNLTPEICDRIDSYLGNNTPPLLKIGKGDSYNQDGVLFTQPSNQNEVISKVEEKVINTIFDMSLRAKNLYLEKKGKDTLESFKKVYKKYYTSSSVDQVITSLDYSSYNKSSDLIILSDKTGENLYPLLSEARQRVYSDSRSGFGWLERMIMLATSVLSMTQLITRLELSSTDEEAKESLSYFSYTLRSKILSELRNLIQSKTQKEVENIKESEEVNLPTIQQVRDYLSVYNPNTNELFNYFYNINSYNEEVSKELGATTVDMQLSVVIPLYDPSKSTDAFTASYVEDDVWKEDIRNYDPNKEGEYVLSRCPFMLFSDSHVDVEYSVLRGINSYVKTALEGTGTSNYYAKYVEGDNALSGRKNSLYYKRYQMLNNRLNYIEGTLSPLFSLLKSSKYFENQQRYVDNLDESYSNFLSVTPISKMEELTWMPAQKATASTIELPGKFYYSSALEAMRAQINSQCVLTCSKCSVQSNCPFYDENEIIKMYVPAAEFIDLYFKDNELDLLAYPEETTEDDLLDTTAIQYPYVYTEDFEGERDYLDISKLKEMHLLYRDILRKVSTSSKEDSFVGRDISKVREELKKAPEFNNEINGEALGYLLGGRYGTVSKNNMALLANKDEDFKEFNGVKIPEYQYLYNVLYIKDTESYINYAISDLAYDVSFEMGPLHNKKTYNGKVKIKEPVSLKSLSQANKSDHVYLVSDDTTDENGHRICPVIYLGQVGNLKYNFGMIMDPNKSIQDPSDSNVYASDVAQWCINYYKGFLTEDPLEDIGGDASNPTKDIEVDHDQYWMPELKKKVYDSTSGQEKWITLEGRPRESINYSEPLMDPDNLDEVTVASGKPVVANYINFLRKVSIRIYDSTKNVYDEEGNYNEQDAWCIPWVKDVNFGESKTLKDGTVIDWNTQRAALSYMKTNLRLVIVKN